MTVHTVPVHACARAHRAWACRTCTHCICACSTCAQHPLAPAHAVTCLRCTCTHYCCACSTYAHRTCACFTRAHRTGAGCTCACRNGWLGVGGRRCGGPGVLVGAERLETVSCGERRSGGGVPSSASLLTHPPSHPPAAAHLSRRRWHPLRGRRRGDANPGAGTGPGVPPCPGTVTR